jgi:hypothetical protein
MTEELSLGLDLGVNLESSPKPELFIVIGRVKIFRVTNHQKFSMTAAN